MLFYDTVLGDTEENCYSAYLSNLDIPLIHFLTTYPIQMPRGGWSLRRLSWGQTLKRFTGYSPWELTQFSNIVI